MRGVSAITAGIIPEDDIPAIKDMRMQAVFGREVPATDIVAAIRKLAER